MATDRGFAQRAHAMFVRAMDLDSVQRRQYVHQSCADDLALRKRVLELLDAADRVDSFLEAPAAATPASEPPIVPDSIGNYLVVGVLGAGGMATVYEAVQEDPHRRIALKVLNQHLSHPDIHARFRFEAEALARLHHPAIAQIYEAGVAQWGNATASPFFAMELVPTALPITDFVEHAAMPLKERLTLFLTACDAVHHGHLHGVIHRDIKPANVLVDREGRLKVIDFGIARATGTRQDSPTKAMGFPLLLGTLHSMSPEQCDPSGEVDIRTDVYSLGVLLYQLVTRHLPHDLSSCTIPEAIRIITEEEPRPASDFRPEAAGDLDAILATAMDKVRERRYASAAALGADIRRFLDDLPIEARPASNLDHLRKFVRRHRGLSIASLAAVVLFGVGGLLSIRLAFVENKARRASEQRERQLAAITNFQDSLLRDIDVTDMGDRLHAALAASLDQLDKPAPDGNALTNATGDLQSLIDGVNFTSLALRMLNEGVLQPYGASIRTEFREEPLLQARLLQQLAITMKTLGLLKETEPMLREALETRRSHLGPDHVDTLQTMHSLGSLLSTLGQTDEAVTYLQEVYDRQLRVLGPDHGEVLRTGTSLGSALLRQGNLDAAAQIWRKTLDDQRRVLGDDHPNTLNSLNNMGVAFANHGRMDEAEACWRELLERRQRVLGQDHPDTRGTLGNLCALLQLRGHLSPDDPILSQMEQALAADRRQLGDLHPKTLSLMEQLGSMKQELGDLDSAEKLHRECWEGRRNSLGAEHPSTLLIQALLANTLLEQDHFADAEVLARSTLTTQRRILGDRHPQTIDSMRVLSDIRRSQGDADEALALVTEALDLARTSLPGSSWIIGQLLSDRGTILLDAGRLSDAEPCLEEGLAIMRAAFGEDDPDVRAMARRLAECRERAEGRHQANPEGLSE